MVHSVPEVVSGEASWAGEPALCRWQQERPELQIFQREELEPIEAAAAAVE